jgi:hypothetical protein
MSGEPASERQATKAYRAGHSRGSVPLRDAPRVGRRFAGVCA